MTGYRTQPASTTRNLRWVKCTNCEQKLPPNTGSILTYCTCGKTGVDSDGLCQRIIGNNWIFINQKGEPLVTPTDVLSSSTPGQKVGVIVKAMVDAAQTSYDPHHGTVRLENRQNGVSFRFIPTGTAINKGVTIFSNAIGEVVIEEWNHGLIPKYTCTGILATVQDLHDLAHTVCIEVQQRHYNKLVPIHAVTLGLSLIAAMFSD